MKEKLFYFLGQDGFLRMNTSVPEFTIFFRKETGFVNAMIIADLTENPFITKELVQTVRNKVRWKFVDQGMEEIHCMVLVISDDDKKALGLKDDNPFFWIIDSQTDQLQIPDGCAEDYYGMREQIDGWLHADYQAGPSRQEYYQADGRKIKSFREQPLVNHFIFIVNMIVFTLCTLTGDLLYNYGTLSLQEVINGQWYRMITALFLHGNVTHIASNMIMLFLLGNVVEKEMGHIKYFILYFGSGLAGSCASLYMQSIHLANGDPIAGSIGASGAIFGIMGGFLWILLLNHGRASNMSLVRVLFLVCYCLFGGMTEERVDNAAHIGGLIAGILIAMIIYRRRKQKEAVTGED